MNRRCKFALIKKHRIVWYEHSLDKLINGKASPEYVNLRFKKLQEVVR